MIETVPTTHYLTLAAGLFCLGMLGVLIRRNALVVFMCIELMLNAANLTFLAFARERFVSPLAPGNPRGADAHAPTSEQGLPSPAPGMGID